MRALVPLAAVLLFALLTAETSATFGQLAREALSANDATSALVARRQGDLYISTWDKGSLDGVLIHNNNVLLESPD